MKNWEIFEKDCAEYLNEMYSDYAEFIHKGSCDSTVPDILVKTKKGDCFYIEAKQSQAQCGQFVLLPNLEKQVFEYSKKNINRFNNYADIIINFMNHDFDAYRNAGTTGKEIYFENSNSIFFAWIKTMYIEKGVRYIITDNNIIFPLENFEDYFNVSAKYRIKRSGSCSVSKKRSMDVKNYILSSDYSVCDIKNCDGKMLVISNDDIDNKKFVVGKYEYMFSKINSAYEVRQLSNTYNSNVIFSIDLLNNVCTMPEEEFIKALQ